MEAGKIRRAVVWRIVLQLPACKCFGSYPCSKSFSWCRTGAGLLPWLRVSWQGTQSTTLSLPVNRDCPSLNPAGKVLLLADRQNFSAETVFWKTSLTCRREVVGERSCRSAEGSLSFPFLVAVCYWGWLLKPQKGRLQAILFWKRF